MTVFEYQVLTASGEMRVGSMEARSQAEVIRNLDAAGMTPISAREVRAGGERTWRERLTPEPKSEEITGFTMDLAMLLKGGVSLNEAMLILTQMETRRWLVRLARSLHVELSTGKRFSEVLAGHPRLFPPIYTKMIEVAELSGRLEEALTSIALERQRAERLRKRLISAIAYPAFLTVAALGVLFFVLVYIIPQFEGAIMGFRDRIDPSALFVFNLSQTVRSNTDLALMAVVAVLCGFIAVRRLGRGRNLWVALFARLPVTGHVVTYNMTLTFCRTLAILLENGVDISSSLRLIRGISSIPSIGEKIDSVTAEVRAGEPLSHSLGRHSLLPAHVVQMLRVGEESGNLAVSAHRVSVFYEAKLDEALSRLTAVLGPALMIVVSLLIGWLILSIMTALMSINDMIL